MYLPLLSLHHPKVNWQKMPKALRLPLYIFILKNFCSFGTIQNLCKFIKNKD